MGKSRRDSTVARQSAAGRRQNPAHAQSHRQAARLAGSATTRSRVANILSRLQEGERDPLRTDIEREGVTLTPTGRVRRRTMPAEELRQLSYREQSARRRLTRLTLQLATLQAKVDAATKALRIRERVYLEAEQTYDRESSER